MALSDNLVAYYSLDNGTDATGRGNDVSATGTVPFAAGKIGNGADIEVTGGPNYLSRADTDDLSMGDIAFTITAWVKLESKVSKMGIVCKGDSVNEEYYICWDDSSDRFRFEVCSASTFTNQTGINAANAGAPATDGTWYFIVAWHDPTGNTINIKVNNTAETPVSYSAGSYDSNAIFVIGSFAAFGENFDGIIDEVGIWKGRVLDASEMTDLYNSGNGRSYAYITGATGPTANAVPLLLNLRRARATV